MKVSHHQIYLTHLVSLNIAPKTNNFRDTATDYYRELNAGRADVKDFERHIYGQFGGKGFNV